MSSSLRFNASISVEDTKQTLHEWYCGEIENYFLKAAKKLLKIQILIRLSAILGILFYYFLF